MKGLLILALLVLSLLLPPTLGDESEEAPERKTDLLMPVADFLSGAVWLRLKGPDITGFTPYRAQADQPPYALQAPAAALIPYREPSPKFSRTIIVTQDLGRYPYQNEPAVAVDPTNPDRVLIGAIDFQFFSLVAYASIDAGVTWEGPRVVKPFQRDSYTADPVVAFDRNGKAYFAYISIGSKLVTVAGLVLVAEVSGAALSTSEDGGLTWSEPITAAIGDVWSTTVGPFPQETIAIRFIDKPWMAVGPDPDDPGRDNVYITYTEFMMYYPVMAEYPYIGAPVVDTTIKLVVSTDEGLTWSDPVAASPTYRYFLGGPHGAVGIVQDRPIVQGSMPAVAPDGRLYVAYYDSLSDGPWKDLFAPMITWSTDGGRSFAKPVAIEYKSELDYTLPPTLFRAWSSMFPYIGVGPEGNVYMAFAANPPGPDDSDIYLSRSLDGGKTWSRPARVNDDLTTRDQFFPFVATDGDGAVHVIFGDRRDDPADIRYHIYYTRSTDGGETFEMNARVSDYPSNPQQGIPEFVGDYFGVAAGDDVYIVWVDSRVGLRGVPNQDIAVARMNPVPSPSIFVSPPSGPAGEMVTIMGFNFAPHSREVFIELDGVVISSVVTNEEGRFATTVFVPVAGEGAHTLSAIDVTGNAAVASFYTSFGFNTLKDELQRSFEEILSRMTPIEQGPKAGNASVIQSDLIDRVEVLTGRVGGLESDLQQTLTSGLESFGETVSAQLSGISSLLWIIGALAIAAIVISISSLVLLLRRLSGRR